MVKSRPRVSMLNGAVRSAPSLSKEPPSPRTQSIPASWNEYDSNGTLLLLLCHAGSGMLVVLMILELK
jgi:hypothetical protein